MATTLNLVLRLQSTRPVGQVARSLGKSNEI